MIQHHHVLHLLGEVDALLATEERWTKKAFARDAKGWQVFPTHPEATQWCLIGAIERVCRLDGNAAYEPRLISLFNQAVGYFGYAAIMNDDDTSTFEEIKQVIRGVRKRALQAAEPQSWEIAEDTEMELLTC